MIYFSIFLVVVLMIFAYLFTGRDILSPLLMTCAMYLIGLSVVAINANKWSFSLSSQTLLTIMLALIAFGIGEIIVRYVFEMNFAYKKKNKEIILPNNGKIINIRTYQIFLVSMIMIIILIWYFLETYRLSLIGGNPGGFDSMLEYARKASISNSINSLLTLLLAFSTSVSYFLIFVILYNKIFFEKYYKIHVYLFPILIYSLQLILTTGRQPFIQMITTCLIIGFILIKIKNNWSVKNSKLVNIGIFSVATFLGLFFLLGFLTNKSFLGFGTTVSLYMGGSIVGLNKFLLNLAPPIDSVYLGSNTLFGFYSSLSQIGFSVPEMYAPLDFFLIGNHGVNIYTPLVRYIIDFTFFGMLFIQFMLGILYTTALLLIRYKQKVGVFVIIFAMFYYPIVESAIEERFFMLVFSFNAAFKACGVFFIYWFFLVFLKKRNIKYFE